MKKEIAKNKTKSKEITLGEVAKKLDNYATKTDAKINNLTEKLDRYATKTDSQIKNLTKRLDVSAIQTDNQIKNLTKLIDGLAVAMANGFKRVEERMDNFDIRFDKLEDYVSFKIDGLQSSIDTLSTNKTDRTETKLLEVRVAKLENKKI